MTNINPAHAARLRSAERDFQTLTANLSDRVLDLRLKALAMPVRPSSGEPNDPYLRALARQALDVKDLRAKAETNKAEYDHLRRNPSPGSHVLGHYEAERNRLARLQELEEGNELDLARLVGRASDSLSHEKAEALKAYAANDAREARAAAIVAAASERVAAEPVTSHAIDMKAAALRREKAEAGLAGA